MESDNFFCEEKDCEKASVAFTIKFRKKETYCEKHSRIFQEKGLTLYPIDLFHDASYEKDFSEFIERIATFNVGLGNVDVMERNSKREQAEAIRVLQEMETRMMKIVKMSCETTKTKLNERFQRVKQELDQLRTDLFASRKTEGAKWPEKLKSVCQREICFPPFLRFTMIDSSVSVASCLAQSWRISEEPVESILSCLEAATLKKKVGKLLSESKVEIAEKRVEFAAESLRCAKSLGHSGKGEEIFSAELELQRSNRKAIPKIFFRVESEFLKEAAKVYFDEGCEAKKAFRYEECKDKLQAAWDLLLRDAVEDNQTIEIGRELGQLLCYQLSEMTQAEEVLTKCLEIAKHLDPGSELALTLTNCLFAVHFHSGKYAQIDSSLPVAFQVFESKQHSAENYWTAVYFLVHSYWKLGKNTEARDFLQAWNSYQCLDESDVSKLAKKALNATLMRRSGDFAGAKMMYHDAHTHSGQGVPTSLVSLRNQVELADLYNEQHCFANSKELCLSVIEQCRRHYPRSLTLAFALISLGVCYENMSQKLIAEKQYQEAAVLFNGLFSEIIDAGNFYYMLGWLQSDLSREDDAISNLTRALSLYEMHRNSEKAAQTACLIGEILERQRNTEASEGLLERTFWGKIGSWKAGAALRSMQHEANTRKS